MTRLKKLSLAALVALGLAAGAFSATPAAKMAGDPSQWLHSVEQVAKVNEYEGQHRIGFNFTKIEFNHSNQG